MQRIDIKVRAPTGRAWVASAVTVIFTGELFAEMRGNKVAHFFRVPFSREEMSVAVAVLAVAAVASLVWLALLYLRPGRLTIDVPQRAIERRINRRFRELLVSAPAADWRVHVVYFSTAERSRGTFKRLVLACPSDPWGFEEVLLFTDVDRAEDLVRGLECLSESLGAYRVEIESRAP